MVKGVLWFVSAAIVAAPATAQPAPVQQPPSAEASVSVPREVLERYVGRYALNGTVVTVIIADDGRLQARLDGQPPGPPLRAVSENEFVADAVGVRIWFEGDGPQAPRIRSRYAGSETVGTRLAEGARAPTALDAAAREDAVRNLGSALRRRYVVPEIGARAAARIEAALAAGEYEGLSDPAALAARLSADLATIADDKHLQVNSITAPPAPPPGAGMPLPASEAGVVRADKLAGGIGYIELVAFPRGQGLKPVLDPVMTRLADSTALIIDMRRNIGGLPEGVAYLASFLVPPGQPVHLSDVVSRVEGTEEVTRQPSYTEPTSVSFAGRPVYVLTSSRTFSGGEAFADGVKALGLGTVVGERTAGGGNLTGPVQLGHGLFAMIPFARGETAVTKTNWERRGVEPDVAAPAGEALAAALLRLGQPAVAEVAAASQQQVFAPRTAPLPGSEAALRAVFAGVLEEPADLAAFALQPAEMMRPMIPQLQAQLRSLGALGPVKFIGPGLPAGDAFEAIFANGALGVNIILGPDGLVEGFSIRPVGPGR